jgi:hypothetical protein
VATMNESYGSYIEAQFPQPRLQEVGSDWQGPCVIRLTITTKGDPETGTRSEAWLIEKASRPASALVHEEAPDLWMMRAYAYVWKSYALAANWVSRQPKTFKDAKYPELTFEFTYRICGSPAAY